MGVKLMLLGVRASFLTLGEPEDYQGNKQFRWSATGLIPYKDLQIEKIREAMKQAAKDKWEKKWESAYENCLSDPKATCFIDGKRKDYAGYQEHFAVTGHRYVKDGRPLVMDTDRSPIYKPDNELYEGKAGRIYSGAFVNLQLEFWAQDNKNGKGLRATLLGIQRVRDGDAFGGGSAPNAEDFGDVAEGAEDEALG